METVLGETGTTWSPIEWATLLSHLDPQQQYIVTEVAQYKKQPPFLSYQHEYITLTIQPCPSQPQPPEGPAIIKVLHIAYKKTPEDFCH